ncbi:MAG TPA: glycosyltransferase family 4 protein [Azospirillum sp.]
MWNNARSFVQGAPGAEAAAVAPRRVVVLGPSTRGLGGVAAVLKVVLGHWRAPAFALRHIPTHVDGGRLRKLLAAVRALGRFAGVAAAGRVDVVHVHFSAHASFYRQSAFILLCALLGIPRVGQAHAGAFPTFYAGCGPLRRRYVRFVLNRLDRLFVLSREWGDFYGDLYPRERLVVIPNPVVVPPAVDEGPAADQGPEADDGPVVLALGRLGPGKGTYDILDAIPAVVARFPTARFWFGGDGEVDTVRARIAGEPWADRVRLLGWVDGAEKEAVLRAADVFLLPSYAEGLPMALLEAMAYGLPVVTTPVGGIPQAIAHGETGLLVDPGDVPALRAAIESLLADPPRARALGMAARRLVRERYDVALVQDRVAAVYAELLNGPRNGR